MEKCILMDVPTSSPLSPHHGMYDTLWDLGTFAQGNGRLPVLLVSQPFPTSPSVFPLLTFQVGALYGDFRSMDHPNLFGHGHILPLQGNTYP